MQTKAAQPKEPDKMVRVEEVMELLQVSKSTAYHIMQQLNKELKAKGYIIPAAGRVPRSYLLERCGLL